MLEFAEGLVSLIAVRAVAGGPLVQHSLAEIPQLVPDAEMRIVAIYRQDKPLAELVGETRIEPGDEVFVLAATAAHPPVLGALRRMDRPVQARDDRRRRQGRPAPGAAAPRHGTRSRSSRPTARAATT